MAQVYQRTKDKRAKYLADNRAKVAEGKRDYYLRSTFGITVSEYEEMAERQNHRCAICGEQESVVDAKENGSTKRLAVDHCHDTGKVRGLLCQRCNMGLGYFRDRPDLLSLASKYLTDQT